MQPPQVRTLDQLILESNPAYDPIRQANTNAINTANNRLAENEKALGAAQQNAFGQISQTATRRGALFSGFTPDQQARYTAEKYLPALAGLRTANEDTIQQIQGDNMKLDSEQRQNAMQTREGDLSRLYDYNKTQSDRQFQTEQANLAYQREMQKLQKEQAFAASQNASKNAGPTIQDYDASMRGQLAKQRGNDGFISPTAWAQGKAAWINSGAGSSQDFDKRFAVYKNPKNPWYR